MSRLIDRAELFNRLANAQDMAEIFRIIQEMPTVDLVQCNECAMFKECGETLGYCTNTMSWHSKDSYCCEAERKTDNG